MYAFYLTPAAYAYYCYASMPDAGQPIVWKKPSCKSGIQHVRMCVYNCINHCFVI